MIVRKPIQIIKGDIAFAQEDIIVQVVNCQGVMGAGVARAIRNQYLGIYRGYNLMCKTEKNKKDLLGRVHKYFYDPQKTGTPLKTVMSIFGQEFYGRDTGRVYVDYTALYAGLSEVASFARRMKRTTAIPYGMGAGLAGGEWGRVDKMVRDLFICQYVKYYKFGE